MIVRSQIIIIIGNIYIGIFSFRKSDQVADGNDKERLTFARQLPFDKEL